MADLVPRSGYGYSFVELRPIPFARVHDGAQMIDRVPDIGMADVKRRKAEAQDIGCAEVPDDTVRDQGLHDRISMFMGKADLAAARSIVGRRGQPQSMAGASLRHQLGEQAA